MKLLLTGGTGYLGGFLRADAQMHGDSVTLLGRTQPKGPEAWLPHDLSHPVPELPPADALIYAAFDHLPGRYRGGEGDDPATKRPRLESVTRSLMKSAGVKGERLHGINVASLRATAEALAG